MEKNSWMKDKFKKILEDKDLENKKETDEIMRNVKEHSRQWNNFRKNEKEIFKICFEEIENVVNDFESATSQISKNIKITRHNFDGLRVDNDQYVLEIRACLDYEDSILNSSSGKHEISCIITLSTGVHYSLEKILTKDDVQINFISTLDFKSSSFTDFNENISNYKIFFEKSFNTIVSIFKDRNLKKILPPRY